MRAGNAHVNWPYTEPSGFGEGEAEWAADKATFWLGQPFRANLLAELQEPTPAPSTRVLRPDPMFCSRRPPRLRPFLSSCDPILYGIDAASDRRAVGPMSAGIDSLAGRDCW